MNWKLANDPPKNIEGCWSDSVAVVTNMGNILELAYFGDAESGYWQRPATFRLGEVVEKWIEKPEGYER